jgi:hypothetical protein
MESGENAPVPRSGVAVSGGVVPYVNDILLFLWESVLMDRDSLSAMLQKVRAMKARPSVTVSPSNVFAVASRVLERQRQREHRDERRESLAVSVESAESREDGSPVSVSSPSPTASDLDTISSLDQHSVDQGA